MPKLGQYVSGFDEKLEQYAVAQGWFTEPPRKAMSRWVLRGVLAIVAGGIAIFGGVNLPSQGLLILGVAAIAGGILLLVMATAMPARTMPGAMIRAMLEAYRRTLDKTMAQARSMGQVVDEAAIPLLETPDDAVVWGVALGLQEQVEQVLERTVDDLKDGRVAVGLPAGVVRVGRERRELGQLRRQQRLGAGPDEQLRHPQLRRHDGRPVDDRELAVVVGQRWRVRGRR